jgi:predicted ATPase/predicted Ser/Thr protein kinase
MTPEQYERIGQLFHAALDLSTEQRPAFLNEACGGDEDMRWEVESLLAAHARAGDFVATPAMHVAAEWLARQEHAATLRGRIGAYDVVSLIGRGGMGEVYLAHDSELGRKVALKLLRPALTSNADAVRRFEHEARAASSLNHPNIVTIYAIGDLGDRRFLAMEFVEGRSLAALLGEPVDARSLARLGGQLARALSVAHAAGIVHRDIKPENVMLREDGYVKVLDFGLARLAPLPAVAGTTPAGTNPTDPPVVLGTPRYMSPEQARGDPVTGASDVFSLGVMLYELATATHPFESASTLAMLHAITSTEAPSPRRLVPDMPAGLDRLLRSMLEKAAAARPTAADVEAEFLGLAAGAGVPMGARAPVATMTPSGRTRGLPSQRTPLIGRAAERTRVKDLLLGAGVRLLTLTGPAGSGKTRLAIQVGEDVSPQFDGGVAFVDLAPISDPRLVASAVARSLGVRESGDLPLDKAIAEHLGSLGPSVLLIDNFEQVSDAADLVKDLLETCPALTVLVTSRLPLHIYGEQEFPVPPLPLPGAERHPSPATLMQYASVALFVERAAAGRPDFALTPDNADAVSEICRRLDGLPLAIELAAARVKILPPRDLLARIERPLEVLTGGARDLPERQQTLRQAIKWSYDLLAPAEQKLFRRLSVFSGGFTLDGAEAVCDTCEDLGVAVLDGVTSLVDNSLLVPRGSEVDRPRFGMLETFREYGRERLLEHADTAVGRAHAAYMLVLAEEETVAMSPAEREAWLRACDVEHDNFRTAMQCLVDAGDVEWALRLGIALFRFWEQRDHLSEGRGTLARVLAMPGAGPPTRLRARALYCASLLADIQGEAVEAERFSHAAYAIYRQFDDIQGRATTMTAMAFQAQRLGRLAEATARFGKTVALWARLGDVVAVDLGTSNMANAARAGGNFELARRLFEEVVESSRARGDQRGVASALNGLGDVAAAQGHYDSARQYHHDSLVRFREIDDRWGIGRVLADLASVDLQAGEYADADRSITAALQAFRALGHQRGVARQLESLAWCASCQSRDESAVRLASAAAAIRRRIGAPAKQNEKDTVERTLAQASTRLTLEAFAHAWKDGLTGTLDRLLGVEAAPPL